DVRHDDREADQRHHPGPPGGQLVARPLQEDEAAVEEQDRAEDRVHPLAAREPDGLVAEPCLDLLAEVEDRQRERQAEPELAPEGLRVVALVAGVVGVAPVTLVGGVILVAGVVVTSLSVFVFGVGVVAGRATLAASMPTVPLAGAVLGLAVAVVRVVLSRVLHLAPRIPPPPGVGSATMVALRRANGQTRRSMALLPRSRALRRVPGARERPARSHDTAPRSHVPPG